MVLAGFGSLSEPPAGDGEGGEEGYYYEVGVDQDAVDVGFVAGDTGPVGGDGQEDGDVEEGRPVGEREKGGGGEGCGGLLGGAPEEPGGGGGYSGEEEEEDGGVVAGMRVPEGVEEVVGAPVEQEGHDGSAEEDEGEEEFAGEDSIHVDPSLGQAK